MQRRRNSVTETLQANILGMFAERRKEFLKQNMVGLVSQNLQPITDSN